MKKINLSSEAVASISLTVVQIALVTLAAVYALQREFTNADGAMALLVLACVCGLEVVKFKITHTWYEEKIKEED